MAYSKSELTKRRLIKKAKKVFSEKGYKKATLRMIALEAGVNQSLLYYHFESKRDIASHIMNEFAEKTEKQLKKRLAEESLHNSCYFTYLLCLVRLLYREVARDAHHETFYHEIFENALPREAFVNKWHKALAELLGEKQISKEQTQVCLIIGNATWSGLVTAKESLDKEMVYVLDTVDIVRFSYLDIDKSLIRDKIKAAESLLDKVSVIDAKIL